jgi:hypothetical protein
LAKKLGADVKEAGSNGKSPLSMAVALLITRSTWPVAWSKIDEAGIAPLHVAVQFGNLAMAKCLVKEFDANIDIRGGDTATPLLNAVGPERQPGYGSVP